MGRTLTVAAAVFVLAMIFTGCQTIEEKLPAAKDAVPKPVADAVQDAIGAAAEKLAEPRAVDPGVEPTVEMVRETEPVKA